MKKQEEKEPRPTPAAVFAESALNDTAHWLEGALKSLDVEKIKLITHDFGDGDPKPIILQMLLAAASESLFEINRIDAYHVACNFEDTLDWPVDGALVALLHDCVIGLDRAVRRSTMHWVLRTGIRFPSKIGELVTFQHGADRRCGKVVAIEPGLAQANVECWGGEVKQTITAEQVIYA